MPNNRKKQITQRLWDKAGKFHIPLTIAFELLPICNLHCKMCYVRESASMVDRQGGLLDGKQWLQFAKEGSKLGLLFPLLTGGEPFLHPDFFEIFSGMLELGMQVSINSNGTLIDRKTAVWLGKHIPTRINITLYGSSEETYQSLCGNGAAYGQMRNAVQWLKENSVPVKFNASVTPQNVHDLESIISYAKEVGSPLQIATYMFPPTRRNADMIGCNNRLSPEEAALARVKAEYFQNSPEWFLKQAENYGQFTAVEAETTTRKEKSINQDDLKFLKMSCRAGNSSGWIDWQGNICNCGMYNSAKLSLKKYTLEAAWAEIVKETTAIRYHPLCTTCPNIQICHPCIAMVHNECGDVNGRPEYLCRMNQAAAGYYQEFAKLLKDIPDISESPGLPEIHECDWEKLI